VAILRPRDHFIASLEQEIFHLRDVVAPTACRPEVSASGPVITLDHIAPAVVGHRDCPPCGGDGGNINEGAIRRRKEGLSYGCFPVSGAKGLISLAKKIAGCGVILQPKPTKRTTVSFSGKAVRPHPENPGCWSCGTISVSHR
jgi:hypothetical protein